MYNYQEIKSYSQRQYRKLFNSKLKYLHLKLEDLKNTGEHNIKEKTNSLEGILEEIKAVEISINQLNKDLKNEGKSSSIEDDQEFNFNLADMEHLEREREAFENVRMSFENELDDFCKTIQKYM